MKHSIAGRYKIEIVSIAYIKNLLKVGEFEN